MKQYIFALLILLITSCSKSSPENTNVIDTPTDTFIRAADMSYLPDAERNNALYKYNNVAQDPLLTLKNAGCNTVRVRLWKNPTTAASSFAEVKLFTQRIKQAGLKVWLTVHYSDTWADPGNQTKPQEWNSLSFANLKQEAVLYTQSILSEINPDIIQIGNETNDGFLFPDGRLSVNQSQYLELIQGISNIIRTQAPNTKIMLHYAGLSGADYFFNKVMNIDYDYIGISYYPIWHGKDLNLLQQTLTSLSATYNKEIIIAETAYPFTLGWNDWTNNNVGLSNQLITEYPATPQGQKDFVLQIKSIVKQIPKGNGFCYWGAEWISYRGAQATDGSSWENQAMWDFGNNALPVLDAFVKE